MKTLGVGIVLMVALFFCLPYHLYMKQLWKKNPEKSWEKARKFVSGFFRFELKLSGCKVNVIGKENIPQDGPVLFVGNHRSYFDILIYHCEKRNGKDSASPTVYAGYRMSVLRQRRYQAGLIRDQAGNGIHEAGTFDGRIPRGNQKPDRHTSAISRGRI